MSIRDLKEQIARLPEQPGVYLYVNRAGETIYVGKARSLADRVRSYLSAYGSDPKTDALLDDIDRLEVIVTDSVVEALALENHLIKQRAPRYNILLRDDKNYPYLQLTTTEGFPRVLVARRVVRDGNVYAGPFLPASLARRTMSLTHRLFGIRSCNEVITGRRGRPCLEYDIKRCVAPCVETLCTQEAYARAVEDARLFLEGRNDELLADLRRRMAHASAAERYEEAAQLRDAMRTIEALRDRQQKIATARLGDRDAFGVASGPEGAIIQVFQMRGGRVIERVELVGDRQQALGASEAAIVQAALQQFYEARPAPPEVHIPVDVDESQSIARWLSERAGRRVQLRVPKRGDTRGLLELASRNAALAYAARFGPEARADHAAIEALGAVLALPAVPRRIECVDISTIQGRETVGSLVVFEDGRPKRSEYRKYRVKGLGAGGWRLGGAPEARMAGAESSALLSARGAPPPRAAAPRLADSSLRAFGAPPPNADAPRRRASHQLKAAVAAAAGAAPSPESLAPTSPQSPAPSPQSNDFAAMHEVVLRRYGRLLAEGGPFPDLVIVDGGKGQLSAAYAAFAQLGLANLVAIGIAKREELIYTRDAADPMALPMNHPALLLVARIRDEAHRVAVTFHRHRRTTRDLRSELDDIPGVGPRRRRQLLRAFSSVINVRRATREELEPVVGRRVTDAILDYFARQAAGRAG